MEAKKLFNFNKEQQEKMIEILETLDDLDDVQNIYINVKLESIKK